MDSSLTSFDVWRFTLTLSLTILMTWNEVTDRQTDCQTQPLIVKDVHYTVRVLRSIANKNTAEKPKQFVWSSSSRVSTFLFYLHFPLVMELFSFRHSVLKSFLVNNIFLGKVLSRNEILNFEQKSSRKLKSDSR